MFKLLNYCFYFFIILHVRLLDNALICVPNITIGLPYLVFVSENDTPLLCTPFGYNQLKY